LVSIFRSFIQHLISYILFLYSTFFGRTIESHWRRVCHKFYGTEHFLEADSGLACNRFLPPSYHTRMFILVFTRPPIPDKSLQITTAYPLWAISLRAHICSKLSHVLCVSQVSPLKYCTHLLFCLYVLKASYISPFSIRSQFFKKRNLWKSS